MSRPSSNSPRRGAARRDPAYDVNNSGTFNYWVLHGYSLGFHVLGAFMLWDHRALMMIVSHICISIVIMVDAAPNPVRVYIGRITTTLNLIYVIT